VVSVSKQELSGKRIELSRNFEFRSRGTRIMFDANLLNDLTSIPGWRETHRDGDESIVRESQVSPSGVYEVMVSLLLFFSHFSIRIRSPTRKTPRSCYAVDRPVHGVKSRFSCSPLLYHDYRPVSRIRGHSTKVLSRKNITSNFKDLEHIETYMLGLSGKRGEGTQNAKRLSKNLRSSMLI